MNVDINETGKHNGVMQINDNSASGVKPPGKGNNAAILNGNIGGEKAVFGHQQPVFQQILQGTRSFPGPQAGRKSLI